MFSVEHLSVAYGLVQVLYDIHFDVAEGECVAILGSNGAGKTTILRTISGVVRAKSGTVKFLDENIERKDPSRIVASGLVHVPEGGKIFPYLSVIENLLMGASGRREAWKSRDESLRRVLRLFPRLEERGNLQARLLSGGERQMLVIGRGLMARPKLLMIDEPSLGLAPKVLLEIYEVLASLRREGVTILLSEQNVQQALNLADRGYVIENGRVVLSGPAAELLSSDHMRKAYLGF